MLTDVPQWVAVYTNSRCEKKVVERLTEAGIENYLPLYRVKRHWSDRIKVVEEPLIKSYAFARITAKQETRLRNTEGVVWLVSFGGQVSIIPDEQMEALRQFVDSETAVAVYEASQLHYGAHVEITEGVFEGRRGEIVSDCKDGNFAIKIDALNFTVVVNVDKNILRPTKVVERKKGIFEEN